MAQVQQKKAPTEAEKAAAKAKAKAGARERFLNVGATRVSKAIKALRAVKNCANRKTYDYSAPEAEKALVALRNEMTSVENEFRNQLSGKTTSTNETWFSFT